MDPVRTERIPTTTRAQAFKTRGGRQPAGHSGRSRRSRGRRELQRPTTNLNRSRSSMRARSVPPATSRIRHACVMRRGGCHSTRSSPDIRSVRRGPAKAPARRSTCVPRIRMSLMVGGLSPSTWRTRASPGRGKLPALHPTGEEGQALQDRGDLERSPRPRGPNQWRSGSGIRTRRDGTHAADERGPEFEKLKPHVRRLPLRTRSMPRASRLRSGRMWPGFSSVRVRGPVWEQIRGAPRPGTARTAHPPRGSDRRR